MIMQFYVVSKLNLNIDIGNIVIRERGKCMVFDFIRHNFWALELISFSFKNILHNN